MPSAAALARLGRANWSDDVAATDDSTPPWCEPGSSSGGCPDQDDQSLFFDDMTPHSSNDEPFDNDWFDDDAALNIDDVFSAYDDGWNDDTSTAPTLDMSADAKKAKAKAKAKKAKAAALADAAATAAAPEAAATRVMSLKAQASSSGKSGKRSKGDANSGFWSSGMAPLAAFGAAMAVAGIAVGAFAVRNALRRRAMTSSYMAVPAAAADDEECGEIEL